jgi:hypothetical protein
MNLCLFCNGAEGNYKPDKHVDFTCGDCVQLLLRADQADLKKAYKKALDQGYLRKASALESFIIPEEIHAKRSIKSIKRNLDSTRTARPVRNKKRLPEPVEA